jgi:hypothetical protein
VSVFSHFLFLILSLSSFISCLPFPACITFDLLSRRSAHTATSYPRSFAWSCLVRELTCQRRLHIRHGNLDRRRNLPNNIHPCRRPTPSRLGRFRMGWSIRSVLLYVRFPLFSFFPPAFCFQGLSYITIMRNGQMKENYGQGLMRLTFSMGSRRFNVPDLLLLDNVSFDK